MRPGPTHADILLPYVGNQPGVLELLDNILEKTEIPCRVILCDDGNEKGVLEGVRIFARDNQKLPMVVIRNEQPMGWNLSLLRCREHLNPMHDYFAVLAPEYLIESAQWFGHMVAPLQRDGVCYATIANPNMDWNSQPPVRIAKEPSVVRAFAMFKRKSNPPMPVGPASDFGAELFRSAKASGNTVWEVPSARLRPSLGGLFKFVELSAVESKKREQSRPMVVINR